MEKYVQHERVLTTSKYSRETGFDTIEELEDSYERYILPLPEYALLDESGINDKFTELCGYDFDDCEGGEVPKELLQTCYNLVKPHSDKLPVLCSAFEKAIEYGTYLDFDY